MGAATRWPDSSAEDHRMVAPSPSSYSTPWKPRGRRREEAVETAELAKLEEKLAAAEERLLEVLRQEREGTRVSRQTWSTLFRVEQLAVHWFMAKDAVGKRRVKRKKKKRKRREAPEGSSSSLWASL